jgi:hypothetical protein
MYYKLTNQLLFYKIQQTRRAYAFWNALDDVSSEEKEEEEKEKNMKKMVKRRLPWIPQ